MKQAWTGRPADISTSYRHEQDGNTDLIWSGYRVYLWATLDREPDRRILLEMTPSEAEARGRALIAWAHRARELNAEAGTTKHDPLADR